MILARSSRGVRYPGGPPIFPVRRSRRARRAVNAQAAGSNPATGANTQQDNGAIFYWLGYLTLYQVERDRYPLALPMRT